MVISVFETSSKKGLIDRDIRPDFFRFCTLFLADSASFEIITVMIFDLYLNLYIDDGNGKRSSENLELRFSDDLLSSFIDKAQESGC